MRSPKIGDWDVGLYICSFGVCGVCLLVKY